MLPVQVLNCLVCEEVRPEAAHGKATLVGYLGILPNVDIYIAHLSKPVERMTFLLTLEAGAQRVELFPKILDPSENNILAPTDFAPLSFEGSGKVNIGITMHAVTFPIQGKYKFQLIVNGELGYESTFQALQGPSPETRIKQESSTDAAI